MKKINMYGRLLEKDMYVLSNIVYHLHLYNGIISEKMYDGFDLLDEENIDGKNLWEFRKMAEKIWLDYIKRLKTTYTKEEYSFLYDYSNNFYSLLKREFDGLYNSMVSVLAEHGVRRKEIIAHLQCAIIAADIAISAFDLLFQKFSSGKDLQLNFKYMRLDKLKLNIKRVQDELSKREEGPDIDFGENKQCQTCYMNLVKKNI